MKEAIIKAFHGSSENYFKMSKFHFLDHLVEDLEKVVTLYVLEASPFEH